MCPCMLRIDPRSTRRKGDEDSYFAKDLDRVPPQDFNWSENDETYSRHIFNKIDLDISHSIFLNC